MFDEEIIGLVFGKFLNGTGFDAGFERTVSR
jgi:hypothetical protein